MLIDESTGLLQLTLAGTIVFTAYFIRGVAGFGSGLVAIPALATFMPLPLVVPIIALLDLLASTTHSVGQWRNVQWAEILSLFPFSLVGILVAVLMVKTVDSGALSTLLALFIMGYALFSFLDSNAVGKVSRIWAAPWGGLGGIVSSMFGTGGPFYVIYLRLRALGKNELRSTIAMILLLDSIARSIGYSIGGLVTSDTLWMLCAGAPLIGLALYAGGTLQKKLKISVFRHLISFLLLASGIALLVR